ncbi:hypothetical protein FQN54_002800 [Arachnomyces sp. PD_36]|nr:hypothetical protein FQN54_002800 [Arachnomyces sp. PD_36]
MLNPLALVFLLVAVLVPVIDGGAVPLNSKRQYPADPTGVKTIHTPSNVTLRYKEPGKDGVCETTPGVNSYSGYIDVAPDMHVFFWFFESRNDPATDPVTLWLNGGPGSDSLMGLFQGFSYSEAVLGSVNNVTKQFQNSTEAEVDGRYAMTDASELDTTDLAAVAAWHTLQGFYSALPQLDSEVKSRSFNLWTESYGGHYGPAFFRYFHEQNELISKGEVEGTELDFNTLGIINGIIDEKIQAASYPEFSMHNTYGVELVNKTVYDYMKTSESDFTLCSQAGNMCRDNVEAVMYAFSERSPYNIRAPSTTRIPPNYYAEYLALDHVLNSIGVNLNYTYCTSDEIYYAFQRTGDWIFPNFIEDLEELLELPVRISLIYGDADYICNWFGGEAISLAANYTGAESFAKAGYVPMTVDGVEYGSTREYGNFSFTRIYESGHEVPYYQPIASLALFNRSLNGWDMASGEVRVTKDYGTVGEPTSTHTEPFPELPEGGEEGIP